MATVDPTSSPLVVTPGRELAVRALLASPDGTQQRVSDLLGVSRRTIGRLADAECSIALRDPEVLAVARTYLENTASRGSTAEERDAALAWIEDAARDERPHGARRNGSEGLASRPIATAAVDEHTIHTERKRRGHTSAPTKPTGRRSQPAPRSGANGPDTSPHPLTAMAAVAIPQDQPVALAVTALRRQQQRIQHRSALIAYVLVAEHRHGGRLTMGDALAELLEDITEAAHTIGTILQQTETANTSPIGTRVCTE